MVSCAVATMVFIHLVSKKILITPKLHDTIAATSIKGERVSYLYLKKESIFDH